VEENLVPRGFNEFYGGSFMCSTSLKIMLYVHTHTESGTVDTIAGQELY